MDIVLKDTHCTALPAESAPLTPEEQAPLFDQIDPEWSITKDGSWLEREFEFEDFKQALAFVNKVAEVAESEGHHPDISFTWGLVILSLSTHDIEGVSQNDFILASKIDQIEV